MASSSGTPRSTASLRARFIRDVAELDRLIALEHEAIAVSRMRRSAAEARTEDLVADASKLHFKTQGLRQEIDDINAGLAPPKADEQQRLDALKFALAERESRIAELQGQVQQTLCRAVCARARRTKLLEYLSGILNATSDLAQDETEAGTFIDQRVEVQGLLESLSSTFREMAAEREAVLYDVRHDVEHRLDQSDTLEASIDELVLKNRASMEQAMLDAHALSDRLTAAFGVERNALITAYQGVCARNKELRHHLHRGTHHGAASTQPSDKERNLREDQRALAEDVHRKSDEHDVLLKANAELVRQMAEVEADAQRTESAYQAERRARRQDAQAQRLFLRTAEHENAEWTAARLDLEMLLKYTKIGHMPDGVAATPWRTEALDQMPVATRTTAQRQQQRHVDPTASGSPDAASPHSPLVPRSPQHDAFASSTTSSSSPVRTSGGGARLSSSGAGFVFPFPDPELVARAPDVTVRPASKDDVPALRRLLQCWVASSPQGGSKNGTPPPSPLPPKPLLHELLFDGVTQVAVAPGEDDSFLVVGACLIRKKEKASAPTAGRLGVTEMTGLLVAPERRGHGIGTRLLLAAETATAQRRLDLHAYVPLSEAQAVLVLSSSASFTTSAAPVGRVSTADLASGSSDRPTEPPEATSTVQLFCKAGFVLEPGVRHGRFPTLEPCDGWLLTAPTIAALTHRQPSP